MRVTRDIISPVFLSIDPSTKEVVRGLGGVPGKHQAVVMAGNHQMFGLDGVTIVEEFIREREQVGRWADRPVFGRVKWIAILAIHHAPSPVTPSSLSPVAAHRLHPSPLKAHLHHPISS